MIAMDDYYLFTSKT